MEILLSFSPEQLVRDAWPRWVAILHIICMYIYLQLLVIAGVRKEIEYVFSFGMVVRTGGRKSVKRSCVGFGIRLYNHELI